MERLTYLKKTRHSSKQLIYKIEIKGLKKIKVTYKKKITKITCLNGIKTTLKNQ